MLDKGVQVNSMELEQMAPFVRLRPVSSGITMLASETGSPESHADIIQTNLLHVSLLPWLDHEVCKLMSRSPCNEVSYRDWHRHTKVPFRYELASWITKTPLILQVLTISFSIPDHDDVIHRAGSGISVTAWGNLSKLASGNLDHSLWVPVMVVQHRHNTSKAKRDVKLVLWKHVELANLNWPVRNYLPCHVGTREQRVQQHQYSDFWDLPNWGMHCSSKSSQALKACQCRLVISVMWAL